MHIRSVHILRCPEHGPHEVFGLLGRIPKSKRCLYVRPLPLPYHHCVAAYCCIRLTFLRIEFQGNSTYKGDETLKPDEHRDPSGMLPGSLCFLPDVRSLYPFQFLESLGVFQASTNQIVIPELPALRKLTISYSDSYCNFGCVKVDLSKLPRLSTFRLENMDSQSLLISGEALTLRSVTISWSDFDLLDFHKLGRNIEEIEVSFSNLLCPSHQCRIKLPNLQSLVLQHSVDFFRHVLTNELPSLEYLLIEGIYDDSDMRDFLPELSNPHDRDSIRLRANDGSLPQFLRQARSRIESWRDVKIKQQQYFLAELSLDKHGTTHWRP